MAHRRRAGMIALPGEGEVPATVADDRGADGYGLIGARQTEAMLDMEFDERTDSGQPRLVTPDPIRVEAIATGDVGEGVAGRVLEPECAVGLDRTGEQPRTEAGDTEARTLSPGEHGPGEGAAGPLERARGLQFGDGRRPRGGDPGRSVEFAASGHVVEMGAGDHGILTGRGGPRPRDTVGIDLGVETAAVGLGEEPIAQFALGGREPGTLVAGPTGVAAG